MSQKLATCRLCCLTSELYFVDSLFTHQVEAKETITDESVWISSSMQRKSCLIASGGLVDFSVKLADSVITFTDGEAKFLGKGFKEIQPIH